MGATKNIEKKINGTKVIYDLDYPVQHLVNVTKNEF